jgi:hypothetical protein
VSRKVVNMPPYSSLNNKREAPAYEELINFPRAKDKVRVVLARSLAFLPDCLIELNDLSV